MRMNLDKKGHYGRGCVHSLLVIFCLPRKFHWLSIGHTSLVTEYCNTSYLWRPAGHSAPKVQSSHISHSIFNTAFLLRAKTPQQAAGDDTLAKRLGASLAIYCLLAKW